MERKISFQKRALNQVWDISIYIKKRKQKQAYVVLSVNSANKCSSGEFQNTKVYRGKLNLTKHHMTSTKHTQKSSNTQNLPGNIFNREPTKLVSSFDQGWLTDIHLPTAHLQWSPHQCSPVLQRFGISQPVSPIR